LVFFFFWWYILEIGAVTDKQEQAVFINFPTRSLGLEMAGHVAGETPDG
jgi:hypothetical protein